jgi:hypothetical protein
MATRSASLMEGFMLLSLNGQQDFYAITQANGVFLCTNDFVRQNRVDQLLTCY